MKRYTTVLTIAGSDPSGGAGIQADLKTISALGSYGASAITAITVQNTRGVTGIHAVPPAYVRGQIDAVMNDICPDAIKIGMIDNSEIAEAIADAVCHYRPRHVVFDPVMVSTSGQKLINDDTIAMLRTRLFPLATLITPNLQEAETLLGRTIGTTAEMERAAADLLAFGSGAVLIKGGHLTGETVADVLHTAGGCPIIYNGSRVESKNTHGTGCTLSSAIATLLAQGLTLEGAVAGAKDYVAQAIASGAEVAIGGGHGPVNHLFNPLRMVIRDEETKEK